MEENGRVARLRALVGSVPARGALMLGGAQVVYSASAFLLALALTHFLSRDDFGTYRYVIATASAAGAFSLTGYVTAIIREGARGTRALRAAIAPIARWSLPAAGALAALAGYYLYMGNGKLGWSFAIAAAALPLTNAWNVALPYLTGRRRYGHTVLVSLANNTLPALGCVVVALVVPGVATVAGAFLILSLIGAFVGYRLARAAEPADDAPEPGTLPYAKHLSVMYVLAIIADQADRLLAFQFVGPAGIAIYTIAIAFPEQAKALGKAGADLLLARFSEAGAAGDEGGGAGRPLALMLLAGAVAAGGYVLLAPWLVGIFFPGYRDAVPYSQVFALSLPAVLATFVPQGWLQAHRRTRSLYQLGVGTSAFQIVAMAAGTLWGGLWGLVAARVVARYVTLLGALLARSAGRA